MLFKYSRLILDFSRLGILQPLASEVSPELFSDEDMKYIYKKLDDTLIWSRVSIFICPF